MLAENKMGTMEIKKLVMSMSIPIIISMIIQALYNIVDSMFVARVSEAALTAVSLCYPIQMILVAVACGTGVGINSLLSRFLGLNKRADAEQVAMHGLILSICNGLVFALLGLLFSKQFILLFTQDIEIIRMGSSYMQICTLFSTGIFVQITYERIMQATGNTVYNMIIQGVGAVINIVLDPIFIFGYFGVPALGVTGAAIATVIGQITAMILGILITKYKINIIQLHFREFKFDCELVKKVYKIAIPAILMQSILSFMTVFMNMILVQFSTLAVSVFSIYYKLQQFVFMAVSGITNAIIPIISFNWGAKNKQRVLDTIHFSLLMAIAIMVGGTIIFQLYPAQLLFLFDAKENMLNIGIPALKIISLSFVFAGISMILCSVFQALDQGNKSLLITILRQMIILVPCTYGLALLVGLDGSWWSFVITELVCCVLSLLYLRLIKLKTISKIS